MYWYEDEVRRIEKLISGIGSEPTVVFYGSSTIRLWDNLNAEFPNYKTVNLGFGGSTLAACTWFFDRLIFANPPKVLLVYAGDNDLGDGRHPEEILIFFQQLMTKVGERFGNIPCFFVSLKPSPERWHLADQFRYTNNLIENEIIKYDANWKFIDVFKQMLDKNGYPMPQYYTADRLHLSTQGYQLWREIIGKALSKVV
jgi:lysophospholipase L1-like esterase